MIRRFLTLIAACAAAIGGLALLPAGPALGAARPPWAAPISGSALSPLRQLSRSAQHPEPLAKPLVGPLAGCERRLEASQRLSLQTPGAGTDAPVLAIVGASFTAGVGPGHPDQSWAVLLARQLHWNAVIYGAPGAGYLKAGVGRKGPVTAELTQVNLRGLNPALVIVQAGHDDIGMPAAAERQRVTQVITIIRAQAPRARIALLTVFPGRRHPVANAQTDRAIVTAGQAADHQVIIMDPLTGRWVFGRSSDGLHPTAAGSAWIASKAAGILRTHGVLAAPVPRKTAGVTVCDSGIPAPRPPQPPRAPRKA